MAVMEKVPQDTPADGHCVACLEWRAQLYAVYEDNQVYCTDGVIARLCGGCALGLVRGLERSAARYNRIWIKDLPETNNGG